MSKYGDHHRMFVQIMLARKVLFLQELEDVIRCCHEKFSVPCFAVDNQPQLAKFISDVNSVISPFHMRIKGGVSEENGSHFYALLNMKDDELSKCATKFSPNEMKFFKKLVVKIVESDSGSIMSTEALHIVYEDNETTLRLSAAEDLLSRMAELGCLVENNGKISLGPLAQLELEPYLQEQFGDELPRCHVCRQICVKGELCPNSECSVKLHLHCATSLRRSSRSTSSCCPSCKQAWER
uniref:Non-structural maintenance of chromosomes element 1 homolog n=1 Tax=Amblyomma aureolatum TaxID=187763 RepID=A0A1E1XDG5_9ACAR